ncbi:MAG: helix-turn-helix domain-containing protein [Ferruginibacter sp.]
MATHAPVFADEMKEYNGGNGNVLPAVTNQPVILHQGGNHDDIHHHEDVEESLSIMDKEKELIIKALKKHKGKRKDASLDLGISERTLYRKLKEYDIEE